MCYIKNSFLAIALKGFSKEIQAIAPKRLLIDYGTLWVPNQTCEAQRYSQRYAGNNITNSHNLFFRFSGTLTVVMGCGERVKLKELIMINSARPYRVENGTIRFTVTSDATTGPGWLKRFSYADYGLDRRAEQLLLSPDFKPTSGITTEIVVMGESSFRCEMHERNNIIRTRGYERGYVAPNPEVACLILMTLNIAGMRLHSIVTVHEQIGDDTGLLQASYNNKGPLLNMFNNTPGYGWLSGCGFAFVDPQAKS